MPAYIDFETRSTLDIKKVGTYVYSNHETTQVLCLAYAIDQSEVQLWKPGLPFPKELIDYVKENNIVSAHNATFEFNIWNNTLLRSQFLCPLKLENIECTMAKCYSRSLPGKLEEAALALKLPINKDKIGNKIMLQLSRPRKVKNNEVTWYEESEFPDKYELLYAYCKQDVEVERMISKKIKPLSEKEKKIWMLDYKINHTGVEVDVKSIYAALRVINEEKEHLDSRMQFHTNNEVDGCQSVTQITRWIKNQGVDIEGISKSEIKEKLNTELPYNVLQVLKLRSIAGKSSTAKLETMLESMSSDNRIREMFQYHGANTGRWAGRRVQLQNFPRPTLKQKEIDDIFKILNYCDPAKIRDTIDLFYAPPLLAISDCLRSFLVAKENHRFIVVDWSAIEARVLAWLAGQENTLEIFKTSGKIYEHAASGIYNVSLDKVTKDQRFIGKVAILALGYQGGKKAFTKMAKVYGVDISEEKAEEIKTKWRQANPKIVNYWYALEEAAISAIEKPGAIFKAGAKGREVSYFMQNNFLYCKLPSERIVSYPYASIQNVEWYGDVKPQIKYMARNAISKKWEESHLYGGLLSENITQAVASDILRDALLELDNKGYNIVMHIHDEIVCEMKNGEGSLEEMKKIMCSSSQWAKNLPLASEGYEAARYKKE